jgi:AcrR family transcriptional regulator
MPRAATVATAADPAHQSREQQRERSRAETRERICTAAMRLFLEEGIERTSMRRIADAVGYTPGALYSYFRDKEDVLFELHRAGFDRLRAAMRTLDAEQPTPRQRLMRIGEVYIRFAIENPHYYELMFILSDMRKRIGEQERWNEGLDTYDMLRSAVREAMDDGVIPPGDVEAAVFALWSHVHGTVSLLLRGRCVIFPDEALPALVTDSYQWLIRAVTAQERPRPTARPGTRSRKRGS